MHLTPSLLRAKGCSLLSPIARGWSASSEQQTQEVIREEVEPEAKRAQVTWDWQSRGLPLPL